QTVVHDLTWPGALVIGLSTLQIFWRRTSILVWFLAGIVVSNALFPMLFPRLHLTQPSLMFAYLGGMLLVAVWFGRLRPVWRHGAGILCIAWAGWLAVLHAPFIMTLTDDKTGVAYAAAAERVDAPPGSVLMAPWGSAYFVLAYAHLVEGRMADYRVVDHRADFRTLTQNGTQPVYTHASTLYLFGADWWAQHIDVPLQVVSAGPNMVKLAVQPFEEASTAGHILGDGIELVEWRAQPFNEQELHVTLYWAATDYPQGSYSTFVHVTDQDAIGGPEDLLAQSDYHVPVYGRYPTTEWQPGQLVREDHVLAMPPDRLPRTIVAGMYWQDGEGDFHQLGAHTFRVPLDEWQAGRNP
ncbi:MAG: hypothetical protein WDZ49_08315, partial [Litorilinea sp.]